MPSDHRPRSGRDALDRSRRQRLRRPTLDKATNLYTTKLGRRLVQRLALPPATQMATLTVSQAALPSISSTSSAPSPPRKKRANSRLQAWHDGADKQQKTGESRKARGGGAKKDPPPLIRKVGLAAQIYGIQGVMGTVVWLQGWREWLYPPNGGPDIVKAYECRPGMGVRYVNGPATHSASRFNETEV